MGEKPIQVTIKAGDNSRIERKEILAKGSGEVDVTFKLPADVPGGKISFAALLGKSIKDALQHVQSRPVTLK
jgi:hypothetical protein